MLACDADSSPGLQARHRAGAQDASSPGGPREGSGASGEDQGGAAPNLGLTPDPIIVPGQHRAGEGASPPDAGAGDAAPQGSDAGTPDAALDDRPLCGNGVLDPGELCDRALHGCCNPACDGLQELGTTCRAAAGSCDIAERCDGTRRGCPPDGFRDASAVCREAAGACDRVETCSGATAECPPDTFAAGVVCRAQNPDLACDAADVCDGRGPSCPDRVAPAGSVCRAREQGDACDAVEQCDGVVSTCPLDERLAEGAVCDAGAGTGRCREDLCCPGETVNTGVGCSHPSAGGNLVFVTSASVAGDTGGLSGADGLCDQLAAGANLAGSFTAWLSSVDPASGAQVNAIDRVSGGPYYLVGDAVNPLAADRSALRSGQLERAPDQSEWGVLRESVVWTGTSSSGGALPPHCAGWQSASASELGGQGDSTATDSRFSDAEDAACNASAALYCFEDDCPGQPVVDFDNDPQNCGFCGNTCASGRCQAGVCE